MKLLWGVCSAGVKFCSRAETCSAFFSLTLQRGVTGTARMLHALTHSSISRQVREQM
jgi:hypothetical protein